MAARGDDPIKVLKGKLTACEQGRYLYTAFLSHRGAGKTTELKRLCADIKAHFECYYFDANAQLDPQHLTTEDLLLALTFGVEEHFEKLGKPLPSKPMAQVHQWFADIVRTTKWGLGFNMNGEAAIGGGIDVPYITILPKIKAELKAVLRTESDFRKEVREAFRRYPSALITAVNRVMDAAQERLNETDKDRRLLVVIDNLDRYDPEVVDALLIKRNLLRDVRVNLIVTPPIALYYRPLGEPLTHHYECEVMNTIRLRDSKQKYDEFAEDGLGYKLMEEALAKRLDLNNLIPELAARKRLISASGGAIRDLIRLTREAAFRADGGQIRRDAVEKAVKLLKNELRDRINANGWAPTLAKIALDKQVHEGQSCMLVLFQRLALKYNGDGWYDIHPLAAELPEVSLAIAAEQASRSEMKREPNDLS